MLSKQPMCLHCISMLPVCALLDFQQFSKYLICIFWGVQGPRIANNSAQLISLQFSWRDQVKPVGSSFIGTSPEFEIALYTIIFHLGRNGANQLEIDDYDVEIVVHKMRDDKLGSSYPVALTPIEK